MAQHTFSKLRRKLRELPNTVATAIAKQAAPELTGLAIKAYDSTSDVYGMARRVSEVDGAALSLRRTGDAERAIKFEPHGTVIRVNLGTTYTKYLIGKYRILPNGFLPKVWRDKLDALVQGAGAPA